MKHKIRMAKSLPNTNSTKKILSVGEFIQNDNKLSKIISKPVIHKTSNATSNVQNKTPKIINTPKVKHHGSRASSAEYENLPVEILLKIFKMLNFDDLVNCNMVCKRWNNATHDKTLWSNMARLYKCVNDYEKELKVQLEKQALGTSPNHGQIVYKLACLNVLRSKSEKSISKYKEQLYKKLHPYTRQVDLRDFLINKNFINFQFQFHDKKMNCIYSNSSFKVNPFEMSASIIWPKFDEIDTNVISDIAYVTVYAKLTLLLEMTNKTLNASKIISNNKQNTGARRIKICEFKFSLRSFDSLNYEKLYENSIISLYANNDGMMFGVWNTKDTTKSLAFVTYNLAYKNDFVEKDLSYRAPVEDAKAHKINPKDLALDSKYGLHDYFVYFCFRNQTNSVFLTHAVDIYKTRIEFCKELKKPCMLLDVINSDDQFSVGPELTSLPKFMWSTEAFNKNTIDLLTIIDLCIQDSNKQVVLASSFPVNVVPDIIKNQNDEAIDNMENSFISSKSFFISLNKEIFYLNVQINCLEEGFTYSKNPTSYHIKKMQIWMGLEFINSWLGTNFK